MSETVVSMADATRKSYDILATDYADRFLGELAHKPLDRALLEIVADEAVPPAPVADVGCGPGHVAGYLYEHVSTLGLDLSPRMVEIAARTHPEIGFFVADMRSLPVPDQTWGGIVALYSIIHIPLPELPAVFAEFHRVLRPGGPILLSFHLGDELRHLDELWDHPVSLDFHFYDRSLVEAALVAAGFVVNAYVERRPYEHEVDTTRAYLMGHRPS
ncbi:MAG TPA: class I SAM-dependent methyltransferase [Streptosporangiaceae bacterium]